MDAYYSKQYHVPHTQVILMSKITIVSGHMIRTFKLKYKIWKKNIYIWGSITSNIGLPKFQGCKTSSQSRYMYGKGKNNPQFVTYINI